MRKIFLSTVAAAALALAVTPALADWTDYSRIGAWHVGFEPLDSGDILCQAGTHYQNRTQLTFATTLVGQQKGEWLLHLSNPAWTWIKQDASYPGTIDAPNGEHWNVKFTGAVKNHVLFAFVKKDVINSLATEQKGRRVIFRQGNKILTTPLSLDNSAPAIRAVVHCAQEHPVVATTNETPNKRNTEEKGPHSGTGFFVADNYILTNWHVIKSCESQPMVNYPDYKSEEAFTAGVDEVNDLVLLKTSMKNIDKAPFRFMPKLGEQVASFGFPYGQAMSTSGNFTLGNVTATVGVGDDTGKFQFSAPLQPGNSGGPVMDASGQVLGVAQLVLGTLKMAELAGGAVPQNVNFAISASVAVNFLMVKGVTPKFGIALDKKLEPEALAEAAKKFTVHVYCERGGNDGKLSSK
jgi:serine protease Do